MSNLCYTNTSLLAHEQGDSKLFKLIKYVDPVTSDLSDMASLVDPQFRNKYISSEKTNVVKNHAVLEA